MCKIIGSLSISIYKFHEKSGRNHEIIVVPTAKILGHFIQIFNFDAFVVPKPKSNDSNRQYATPPLQHSGAFPFP